MTQLKGYSLLEIILVTTFVLIFMVVVNPGTYIDRFSSVLLKMSVLNESMVLVNKLNMISMSNCEAQSLQQQSFLFLMQNQPYAIHLDTNITIQNTTSETKGVLVKYINEAASNGMDYYNSYFSLASSPSDLRFIDLVFHSSLLDHMALASFTCSNQQIDLRRFE